MKITTWNINSVRLRIDLVKRFLEMHAPDVLCLQEIKCTEDQFPAKAFAELGYTHQAVNGQKGYHGVATVSRAPLEKIEKREFCEMGDARHVSALLPGGARLHNFYIPSGGDEPDPVANDKFDHKLKFMTELTDWFSGMRQKKSLRHIMVGDFNVAPLPSDVWSHKQLLKVVSHTPIEVERLEGVQKSLEWLDVARELIPEPERLYTWWSYRARDWRKSNRGRRLDHIWVTPALRDEALSGGADAFEIHYDARDWEKPSDHAPVSLQMTPA